MKASDKQGIAKKIVFALKKRYKGSAPKKDLPILETMLYAICLENAPVRLADVAYERLHTEFHDLNEVRVSSIAELEHAFRDMSDPEWRAMRIRSVLQYVFEKQFAFEFESLRRKTLELATKQLGRIKSLTPFVRSYTLQSALGVHVVPLDDRMLRTAKWLGLVDSGFAIDQAADSLKSVVRKNDTPLFCYCLRKLANDAAVEKEFVPKKIDARDAAFELETATERLSELFKQAEAQGKNVVKKKPKKASAGGSAVGNKKPAKRKKLVSPAPSKRTVTIRKKK
jgi:endonuclease-3